jgi:DNA-directed RNA polymerase subunit M/transcription elongation factor TFIIS
MGEVLCEEPVSYVYMPKCKCPRCGCPWRVIAAQLQLRSIDEAAEVFFECRNKCHT